MDNKNSNSNSSMLKQLDELSSKDEHGRIKDSQRFITKSIKTDTNFDQFLNVNDNNAGNNEPPVIDNNKKLQRRAHRVENKPTLSAADEKLFQEFLEWKKSQNK